MPRTSQVRTRCLRGLGILVVAALLAQTALVAAAPARSSTRAQGHRWIPPSSPTAVKPVPGRYQQGPVTKSVANPSAPYKAPKVTLPSAGSVDVALGHGSGSPFVTGSAPSGPPSVISPLSRVGASPVYLGPVSPQSPGAVRVTFTDQPTAARAGVHGLLLSVTRGDGSAAAGHVAVAIDTGALTGLYGGDFAHRLQLVQVPLCALSTPQLAACQGRTPLKASWDSGTGRLTADVALPAAATAASAGTVALAATSVPAGSAGTYTATSIKPSDQWSAGGSTGDFTYTYPVTVPPSLGGAAPNVTLAYSSSSVDGQTVSTNAQTSGIGDGWSYTPGSIERTYQPCGKDGIAGSGDECWGYGGHEITASGSGIAGQVVWDDAKKAWRMGGSAATVQLLTGANNGAYDGEYWLVTSTDGTRYYYGAGHLPSAEGGTGSDPATASAWTEPVYCPNSGDGPAGAGCHSASAGLDSYASNMAYRWNLDFAVDPHGNVIEYTYGTETNHYARQASSANLTSYIRGGYLSQIDYGWRASDVAAEGASPAPAAKVAFTIGERCTMSATTCQYANLNSSTASNWPDVPYDQNCDAGSTNCLIASPTYWSTKRVTAIQTLANTGTTSAASYKPVDTYALDQSFPDPGDGTSPALRLDAITRSGVDSSAGITGGTAALPPVSFTYAQLPNRVPGAKDYPAFNRYRITKVTTETGGAINVAYTAGPNASTPACDQHAGSTVLPTPSNDTMLCYQEYWTPPATGDLTADWFQKYVVSGVKQTDPTGGSPDQATSYTYVGTPAWHRNDSPFVENDHRTWNQFRGFQQVITNTGIAPDPITQTEVTYLRGMDGDYTSATGGTQRSVGVTATTGDTVTDSNQYAGMTLETQTFASGDPGAPVQVDAVSLPWSQVVATHVETAAPTGVPAQTVYFTADAVVKDRTLLSTGVWRTTQTVNTYDPATGLLLQADDQGDLALVGTAASQETCSTATFATPPSSNPMMTALPARMVKVFVTTGGPVGSGPCPAETAANAVSDTVTYYDGNTSTYGAIGSVGDVSAVKNLDSFSGGTPQYVTKQSGDTADPYGRLTAATNAAGDVTTTVRTPATGTLPTSITTTDTTMGWTTTSAMSPARQLQIKVTDQNGDSTSEKYDALGRVVGAWLPGQNPLLPATRSFKYSVNGTSAPTWVETSTLRDDNTYTTDYQIYDGFMQPRQDQAMSLDGQHSSLVTDTFYDSHGWAVETSTPYGAAASPTSAVFHPADGDASVAGQTRKTFDGRGRVIASSFYSYANLQWTTTTAYPGAERTDVTPPSGGTATSMFTDALGRKSAAWNFTTPAVDSAQTYSPGRSAPSDAVQLEYSTSYIPGGSRTTTTDSAGHVWTDTFDYHQNKVASTDPDAGSSSATYYPDGSAKTVTSDGGTRTVAYAYDAVGRKTGEHANSLTGPLLMSWTYDTATGGKGHLATTTSYDSSGNAYTQTVTGYTNRYAATGETITVPATISGDEAKLAGSYTESMTYTPVRGQLATTAYNGDGGLPSETVTDKYTADGVLANVSGLADYLSGVTVDAWGRTTQSWMGDMPKQLTTTDAVDTATGRVLESTLDRENGTAHVEDLSTTWNSAGMVTSTKDVQDGTSTDLQCFGYNQLGQLATAWTDTAGTATAPAPEVAGVGGCVTTLPTASTIGGPAPYWQSFVDNTAGDLTSSTNHDLTGTTSKDVVRTYDYPSSSGTGGTPNELQSRKTEVGSATTTDSYTYNADGATRTRILASGANQTFAYDAAGRTQSVTDSSTGNSAGYVYGPDGNLLLERDTKAGATSVTLYLPDEQLTLNTATKAESGLRYYATGKISEIRSSSGALTYEYGNDQNTESIALDAATLASTRRYFTPYGAQRGAAPASWTDNRAFLNQPADAAVGLDVLGQRLYDPDEGRFLQRDPIQESDDAQQLGGYSYAGNNPVASSDPSGLCGDSCGFGTNPDCGSDPSCYGGPPPPPPPPPVTITQTGPGTVSVTAPGSFFCRTSGTATVTFEAPKFILVNGMPCSTSQCVSLADQVFQQVAALAGRCTDQKCFDTVMGLAAQPLATDIGDATQYQALGVAAPTPQCSVLSWCGVKKIVTSPITNVTGGGPTSACGNVNCIGWQWVSDHYPLAWLVKHVTLSFQGCVLAFCLSLTIQDGHGYLAYDGRGLWMSRYEKDEKTGAYRLRSGTDLAKQAFGVGLSIGFNTATPDKQANQSGGICAYDEVGGCINGWPTNGSNFGASVGEGFGWMPFIQPDEVKLF